MIFTPKAVLAVAILIATAACAQTTQNQEALHPEGGAEAAPTQPAAPTSSTPGSGMPGGGMMGAHSGGTGQDAGGAGITGAGMIDHMRSMMGMTNMMGAGMRPGVEHVEGRLAFLKAELKITDAQAPQWNAFADTVRANAKAMAATHRQVLSQGAPKTLPERLVLEQKAMTAHLDAFKKTAIALDRLYDTLSADQKKVADEIIVGPMGMPIGMM